MNRWIVLCLLLVSLLITPALPAFADETASAVQSAEATTPDPLGVATMAKDPTIALTFVWVLVCGFLVMFMQAGFAMVEAGFCRAKNATNLMAKNLMDFVIGSLVFFLIGYTILKGSDVGGIFGTGPIMLLGSQYDVNKYLDFFWQLVFCATAATIVSGAVAERLKFSSYLIYSLLVSLFVYPLYGHWVWGGGWLSKLPFGMGHLDFAGSGVVHTIGGMFGLAGAIVLGPRFGKFSKNGKANAIPGHSITLAALGTFILWFGWFGFNPGSTFNAGHLRIAVIAVNTNMAAAAGGLVALLLVYFKTKQWDVGMAFNGVLAGLVAVTAPCGWIEAWAAIVIGLIAGALVVISVYTIEGMGIDDPVGAVSVHGVNGMWGLISVGLFADGTYGNYSLEAPFATGLFYGGGIGQLISQVIGVAVAAGWAFGTGYLIFKIMDKVMGIRVNPVEELKGLDVFEHGGSAYPEFFVTNS
ncbi:ammonium transporter [Desulfatirhabdium butyrativorans]|uniref:ammonium transporter n=1 Tax=Desulfatirhabdium butyrativorans TaxID=340467 RepID=UPI0003FF0422|nr:ammonium transporter [Desulfatirhabdium butyrativorans]